MCASDIEHQTSTDIADMRGRLTTVVQLISAQQSVLTQQQQDVSSIRQALETLQNASHQNTISQTEIKSIFDLTQKLQTQDEVKRHELAKLNEQCREFNDRLEKLEDARSRLHVYDESILKTNQRIELVNVELGRIREQCQHSEQKKDDDNRDLLNEFQDLKRQVRENEKAIVFIKNFKTIMMTLCGIIVAAVSFYFTLYDRIQIVGK